MIYVYSHSVKGRVFYIGQGVASRPRSIHGRSILWQNIVRRHKGVYDVAILSEHETRKAALAEETKQIRALKPRANKRGRIPHASGGKVIGFYLPFADYQRLLELQRRRGDMHLSATLRYATKAALDALDREEAIQQLTPQMEGIK